MERTPTPLVSMYRACLISRSLPQTRVGHWLAYTIQNAHLGFGLGVLFRAPVKQLAALHLVNRYSTIIDERSGRKETVMFTLAQTQTTARKSLYDACSKGTHVPTATLVI